MERRVPALFLPVISILALASLVLAALAAPAHADDAPGRERLIARAGVFLPAFDTEVRLDATRGSSAGVGTTINLQDELGVAARSHATWLDLEWRFARRHRLGIAWSRFNLDGTGGTQRELSIAGTVVPVDVRTATAMSFDLVPFTYSYSILRGRGDELALTVGVDWVRLRFSMESVAQLAGAEGEIDIQADTEAPVPLIGLRYDRHFSRHWSSGVSVAWFSLEYLDEHDLDYDGSALSVRGYAEYRYTPRFGVGAAIDGLRIRAATDRGSWRGTVDYGYLGPQLYMTARF